MLKDEMVGWSSKLVYIVVSPHGFPLCAGHVVVRIAVLHELSHEVESWVGAGVGARAHCVGDDERERRLFCLWGEIVCHHTHWNHTST